MVVTVVLEARVRLAGSEALVALAGSAWARDDPVGPELHHGFHLVLAADVLFATVAAPTLLRTAER